MIHRFVKRDRKPASPERLSELIRRVFLTEKSMQGTQAQKYTFAVDLSATKFEIRQAVESIFDVKVDAVNTLRLPGKNKRFRGVRGRRSPVKKAIVQLAAGQSIDLAAGVVS